MFWSVLQVDDYMYELTVDSIHEIFKGYGEVRKIAIFQKNNQWQALVQYPDHQVRCPTCQQSSAYHTIFCRPACADVCCCHVMVFET
jgi:hypothetical protein